VFGRQLRPDQVSRRGIDTVTEADVNATVKAGRQIRPTATLEFSEPDGGGAVTASVEPEALSSDDPLANIAGTTNAVVCSADPIGEVTITGPGAGLELAGQGVLSDLIAVGRAYALEAARPRRHGSLARA
jgi:homoserine dehydrogenase